MKCENPHVDEERLLIVWRELLGVLLDKLIDLTAGDREELQNLLFHRLVMIECHERTLNRHYGIGVCDWTADDHVKIENEINAIKEADRLLIEQIMTLKDGIMMKNNPLEVSWDLAYVIEQIGDEICFAYEKTTEEFKDNTEFTEKWEKVVSDVFEHDNNEAFEQIIGIYKAFTSGQNLELSEVVSTLESIEKTLI